jgi:GDP-fucose protein O-fucosyltransferase
VDDLGWNNIRMAMETVLGLAIAMGRTLVLPPDQRMYLLGKGRGNQKTDFGFADFFDFKHMDAENAGTSMTHALLSNRTFRLGNGAFRTTVSRMVTSAL